MKLVSKMLALAALAVACSAACAQSALLTVKANITPSACNLVFDNGGVIDYGKIDLAPGDATHLPRQDMAFNVTCSAATKVIYSVTDNRPGTLSQIGEGAFGLGLDRKGNHIGMAQLSLYLPTIDGATGSVLGSTDNGANWSPPKTFQYVLSTAGSAYSITTAGATAPAAAQSFTGSLAVDAVITPAEYLDTTDTINLDGSMTMSLSYI